MNVYRNKRWEKVKSNQLYPGDLVSMTRRSETVPADLLLLHGQCVVDESMLTGESVPLMKVFWNCNYLFNFKNGQQQSAGMIHDVM